MALGKKPQGYEDSALRYRENAAWVAVGVGLTL
jgi:hypothetical protein